MSRKIGVVCAFMEEEPIHSPYSIRGLVNTLSCLSGLTMLCVANGVKVSDELKELFKNIPQATLLELDENIGVPGAWNLGIEQLESDVLLILNDDLWLDAECVMELVKFLEEKPDTAVVGVEGQVCKELNPDNGFPLAAIKYKKKKKRGFFNTGKKWSKGGVDVTMASGFLFALSGDFLKKTGFRFDTRFTPAFFEEFDLAYFARDNGYKARVLLGLEAHYDHIHGVSSGPVEIKYLDKSIMSDELTERNMKLFIEKWKDRLLKLAMP